MCLLFGACGCYNSCSSTGRVNRSIQVIYVDNASTRAEGSGVGSGGVKAKEEVGEDEEEGGGKKNGWLSVVSRVVYCSSLVLEM